LIKQINHTIARSMSRAWKAAQSVQTSIQKKMCAATLHEWLLHARQCVHKHPLLPRYPTS